MNRRTREFVVGWRSLPPLTQATAAIYAVAFVLLAVAASVRTPAMSPQWLLLSLAGVALTQSAYALIRGPRFTTLEALPMGIGSIAFTALRTWRTDSDLTALANGATLSIMAVYVVWFLPPRIGRAALWVASSVWLVAIVHRNDELLAALALMVVAQMVIGAEVLLRIRTYTERLANVDVLTGVANRRGVTRACERQFADLADRGTEFSIISIDINDLRTVNNQRGHNAGDALLVEACEHWVKELRPHDLLGRLGGDEFVIVLPSTDSGAAMKIEERLRAGATVLWSAGVAQARPDDTIATLIDRADQRMYLQKVGHAVTA